MLQSPRMTGKICKGIVLAWLASFIIVPSRLVVAAGSLREEAMAYRIQAYEVQQRGDSTAALSLYQKAAETDPTYPTPQNDIGILLEQAGRLEEAEHAYQQALILQPTYLEAHANLAMLYERLGDKDRAVEHWKKRFELGEPSDPWTARAKERLIALGVQPQPEENAGGMTTRQRVVENELQAHAQSLEEFHAVTRKHSDWP